jgi:hypothetical protein
MNVKVRSRMLAVVVVAALPLAGLVGCDSARLLGAA